MKRVSIPFEGAFTKAYVYGEIDGNSVPLICLHGGPGGNCHKLKEPLSALSKAKRPIIFYDQLGCGYSKVDKEVQSRIHAQTYIQELDNLISYFGLKEFSLLGHSWGGMLAFLYIFAKDPEGLRSLILFSTLPSTKMWNDGCLEFLLEGKTKNEQARIREIFESGNEKDISKLMKQHEKEHVKGVINFKYARKRFPKTNVSIYERLWGKGEALGSGELKDYDVTSKLQDIEVPTLILRGEFDESSASMNEFMHKEIQGSEFVTFSVCKHNSYATEPDLVNKTISAFLDKNGL